MKNQTDGQSLIIEIIMKRLYVHLIYSKTVSMGRVPNEKCPKKSKKSKRGGGVSPGNQKVHNSKCGLFDKRWERLYFPFFPNVDTDFKCFG